MPLIYTDTVEMSQIQGWGRGTWDGLFVKRFINTIEGLVLKRVSETLLGSHFLQIQTKLGG